jgi:hypothetical protein
MSEGRFDRLETRFDQIDDRLRRIEEIVIRIDERLAATLSTLITKAELADGIGGLRSELADKPNRLYLWGVMAALTGAYTAALAAGAMPLTYLAHH